MKFMKPIEGSLPLTNTKDACEGIQFSGFKLSNIQFGTLVIDGTVHLVNKADFDSANSTSILSTLNFISVDKSTDGEISNKKDEMKQAGWTIISDTHIYVENNIQHVLVFGRP